jgi:hypothetical protein
MSCLEILKKSEDQENREWYMKLAKDHFAYINIFHKAIDEIEECKKQNWLIVMDSKVEQSVRIQALKELHSLSKTYTLMVKDLPFVTLLTKYYDRTLYPNYNSKEDAKENTFVSTESEKLDKNLVDNINHYKKLESIDKENDFDDCKSEKATEIMDNNILSNTNKNPDQYKDIDEEMMEEIANQTHRMDFIKGKKYEDITQKDWDRIETPEFKESVRKVKELLDD